MSPDEIFAAQFWPWPDPAVKRDATGRVLFVNAAFLQLYGGQAQDWHGNAVGGWPAPMAAGQSHRFETRIQAQVGGMEEQIYDWIEMVFADGSAFALARNVTFFAAPSGPAPVPDEQPAMADTPPAAANVAPPTADQAPAETPEHAPVNVTAPDVVAKETETESLYSPPTYEAPPAQTEPAAAVVAPGVESVDTIISQAEQTVESRAAAQPDADVYTDTAAPLIEAAEQMVNPLITEPAATEPMPAEPEERAYERRALPIESDSAVLGNNWRDAVIAKAVGAEAAEEINTETSEAEPAPQQSAPQDTGPSDNSEGGARKILLAEDNAINALLTRTLLEAEGHTVDTVEDGQLAVEAMKTNNYDLIFMDMRMPNMDGLEATRKIRALPNVSKDLPIIALTANAFDDDRNACFDSGMNDFMTKPVSAEELADMVVNWTAGAKQKIAS